MIFMGAAWICQSTKLFRTFFFLFYSDISHEFDDLIIKEIFVKPFSFAFFSSLFCPIYYIVHEVNFSPFGHTSTAARRLTEHLLCQFLQGK